MSEQRRFLRALLALTLVVIVLFGGEFLWELNRIGWDHWSPASWSGAAPPNNAKLVDVLSPFARAYNNILAMLLATIGLAIPLTANMHTPKLIGMFLGDRVNRCVLVGGALAAAHVLWVDSLIGPQFPPLWGYWLAIVGALFGWTLLIPYFFYVVRFLDPSNILIRLQDQARGVLRDVLTGRTPPPRGRVLVPERVYQIATVIMKSIERGDRSVVIEGTRLLQQFLEHYAEVKPRLPASWFAVERQDCVGLSDEAIQMIREDRTWLEHRVLSLLFVAYQSVLAKMVDVISSFSDIVRRVALAAAQKGDDRRLELTVRFFNNYLREAIKRKELHAVYDLFYQYRLLAAELCDHPQQLREIGHYFRIYSDQAVAGGLAFVPMFVAFDLGWVVAVAYQRRSPAAPDLLAELLAFDHTAYRDPRSLVIKAKIILAGRLQEAGLEAEVGRLRADLANVPRATLEPIEQDLLQTENRSFWEVTDRQVNFDWVAPEHRGAVARVLGALETAAPVSATAPG